MSSGSKSDEELCSSQFFREIQNVSLFSGGNFIDIKNAQTSQEYQQLKYKPKNKTLPPILWSKSQKIAEFEKLIHSVVSERIKKTFIIELYRGVKYSIKSLKGPTQEAISKKQVKLSEPAKSKQKFLFLDLDETLIFTQRQKICKTNPNQVSFEMHIRPYTKEFLKNISKHFNIYIFTAATRQYAEAVINKLNFGQNTIQDFLCRDDCFQTKRGKIIKDLRIVENRTLKDIILVDNKPQSFGLQIDNGIPILEFYGGKEDIELQRLQKILIEISALEDVRKGIASHYRLRELAQLTKEEMQQYLKTGRSLGNSEKMVIEDYKS